MRGPAVLFRPSSPDLAPAERAEVVAALPSYGAASAAWYETTPRRGRGPGSHDPVLENLLDDARQGRIDRVVVLDLRHLSEQGWRIVWLCRSFGLHGAHVVSVRDRFHLGLPTAAAINAFLRQVCEYDAARVGAARRAGQLRSPRRGSPPRYLWGPDDQRRYDELRARGRTIHWIARRHALTVARSHGADPASPSYRWLARHAEPARAPR